jgi:hypothetical protein
LKNHDGVFVELGDDAGRDTLRWGNSAVTGGGGEA